MANRLAGEPSPYLQQHAGNPVDWWPWGEAAFEEARRRDIPVFLSIGYATCHWCHVMAHESFEDAEVARRMNEAFVCIKVDREERPDVDDVYMAACQAMTARGGWPLTAMLDHDKRPWFAGTYFPKESAGPRLGMLDLVPALAQAWHDQREQIGHQAEHLVEHIRSQRPRAGDAPDAAIIDAAAAAVAASFDPRHGGFGQAPKFPSLHIVRFLIRRHMDGDGQAWRMVHTTLHAMARGGIRDIVGGGFHRYSTDRFWHLPHFEKMLYDQAMALWTFAEAHRLAPDPVFERVLRDTVDYLERDMRHESGAFFAAEDADSEGEEGRFYTWPFDELVAIAGDALARALGAAREGNFHEEATGEPVPRSILFAHDPTRLGDDLASGWMDARRKMLAHRAQRIRPLRDGKVLADWNGLAIAGLAAASMALGDDRLARLAEQAADAVLTNLRVDGGLRHAWTGGVLGKESFAEDHAAMARGLLLLYEATWQPRWLAEAGILLESLEAFLAEGGGYHRTVDDDLFARPVESYDGAIPSANTLAAEAWLHHARLTGSTRSEQRAARVLEAFGGSMRDHPRALVGMLGVAADWLAPWCDVVVESGRPAASHAAASQAAMRRADSSQAAATQAAWNEARGREADGHQDASGANARLADAGHSALLAAAARLRGPRCHVLRHDPQLAGLVEFLPPTTGREVAYLCTGDACGPPVHSPVGLAQAVEAALAPNAHAAPGVDA